MKPRIQKTHFSLLFFEHRYLPYYNILTSEIFNTYKQHPFPVNCVSDFFYLGPGFNFMKSRKII